jgi:hypothetical protein
VSRKARNWAAAAAFVLLAAGGALTFGQVSGTFALFNAETKNPNAAFTGSWIPPLSAATSVAAGSPYSQSTLSWTVGTIPSSGNPITGYQLQYADGGSGGSASCGSYSNFSNPGSSPTSVTGSNTTDWWCFQLWATSATVWTSNTITFTPSRLFVTTGYDQHNVTTTRTAVTNDQIVLTYNENRGAIGGGNGSVNVRFCTTGTDAILISTATISSCGTTPNIGRVTGQTFGTTQTCNTSTTAGNGTTTLTITLKNCTSTSVTVSFGTATFESTGTGIASSGGTNVCESTAAPVCTASTTNRF